MDRVCALVLTRNRKHLLLECLEGLRRLTVQVSGVVIVDNASTDGTGRALKERGLLDEPGTVYVPLEQNMGSAGGYSVGVEVARGQSADWIWIMDDDAEPRPDALERLLVSPVAAKPQTAAMASAVVLPDGQVDLLHRGRTRRFLQALPAEEYRAGHHSVLGFSSFTGLLVRTRVARLIDPPRADFFIWFDDVEYSIRIRRHGEIRLVPDSEVVHKFQMGGDADTRRSRLWNRILGTSYPSAPWEGYWKNVNGVRNFVWIKHRYGHPSRRAFAVIVGAYVVKALLYEPGPFRRIPWIIRAALAGRRGEPMGMTPDRWAEITRT